MKVYVAHPLRGNPAENTRKATEICRKLAAEKQIQIFSPLHAFGFISAEDDQRQVMNWCINELLSCDEL
jgi:hypothetical protein